MCRSVKLISFEVSCSSKVVPAVSETVNLVLMGCWINYPGFNQAVLAAQKNDITTTKCPESQCYDTTCCSVRRRHRHKAAEHQRATVFLTLASYQAQPHIHGSWLMTPCSNHHQTDGVLAVAGALLLFSYRNLIIKKTPSGLFTAQRPVATQYFVRNWRKCL